MCTFNCPGKTAILSSVNKFMSVNDSESVVAVSTTAGHSETCCIRSSRERHQPQAAQGHEGDLTQLEVDYVWVPTQLATIIYVFSVDSDCSISCHTRYKQSPHTHVCYKVVLLSIFLMFLGSLNSISLIFLVCYKFPVKWVVSIDFKTTYYIPPLRGLWI